MLNERNLKMSPERSFAKFRAFAFAATLLFMLPAARGVETCEQLMKRAEPFEKRFDAGEALKLYLAAEKLDPKNPHLPVRIARQYRYLMADASAKVEKLRLGRLALDYSERAAARAPGDAEAQLATGITLGKILPMLPTKEQVAASPRIKASVDTALRLDPRNDTAWHILGRWHRVLADVSSVQRALAGLVFGSLPKGSNEEAERALQKAITLNPDRLMHYIELGRVYAQMGRNEDARRLISKGLAMPNTEKDDVEAKQRGRETIAKLN